MDWLELVVGAALGAVLGSGGTYLFAGRTAQREEQGRAREEGRQRLLGLIQRYQAQIGTARLPSMPRSGMDPDPLSFESRLTFAREVEVNLAHLDGRTAHALRGYVELLTGPVVARMGQRLAHISPERDTAMMRAEVYMQSASPMSEAEINDRGLIGAASRPGTLESEPLAREAAANKLAEMEKALRNLR